MAIPKSIDRKSHLRTHMRHLLRGIPLDSQAVRDALDQWLANHPALRMIAVFSPLPGEVDLAEIVVRHPDRCWVYPRVAGDSLSFHVVANPALDLTPGAFGIREPHATLTTITAAQIDAFLCPGLAFDGRGGRLGRGRGYYDRILADARADAKKVGVCHAHQLVPDTFQELHDVRMDVVISG